MPGGSGIFESVVQALTVIAGGRAKYTAVRPVDAASTAARSSALVASACR